MKISEVMHVCMPHSVRLTDYQTRGRGSRRFAKYLRVVDRDSYFVDTDIQYLWCYCGLLRECKKG